MTVIEPVTVAYGGLTPEDSSIVEFPKFIEAIQNNGYILTDGENTLNVLGKAPEEGIDWLVVVDPVTNEELLVIVDDIIDAEITLSGFLEVLEAIDEFAKGHCGETIYEQTEYNGNSDKSDIPPNFSDVFGMSPEEYLAQTQGDEEIKSIGSTKDIEILENLFTIVYGLDGFEARAYKGNTHVYELRDAPDVFISALESLNQNYQEIRLEEPDREDIELEWARSIDYEEPLDSVLRTAEEAGLTVILKSL